MPQVLKNWLPVSALLILLIVLLSAVRIYIGGPDGLEVVWKGELEFPDTVINVADYAGLPRKEMEKKPKLLAQMEDMGLFESENWIRRRKHRKQPDSSQVEAKNKEGSGDESKTIELQKAQQSKTTEKAN